MQCQRDGCHNPVTGQRRRFCCGECQIAFNRAGIARRSRKYYEQTFGEIRERRRAQRRARTCLRCQRTFQSDGPWNRICSRCSDTLDSYSRTAEHAHSPTVSRIADDRQAYPSLARSGDDE
jgi:hypothetical protein